MLFSLFSLFKTSAKDQFYVGDTNKPLIYLLDIDPECERLKCVFQDLDYQIVVLSVEKIFPSSGIYNIGNIGVREKLIDKLVDYANPGTIMFVSSDLDNKLRECVDVSNSLVIKTAILNFSSVDDGGSVYQNTREGYDYSIVDSAYFVDPEICAVLKKRSKGISELNCVGSTVTGSIENKSYKDYLLKDSKYCCVIDELPAEFFGWVVKVCVEHNIKIYSRLELLRKDERQKYNKFCTFIPEGNKYQGIIKQADVVYKKSDSYKVIVAGREFNYVTLPDALYPISEPIELDKVTNKYITSSLDLAKLKILLEAGFNKKEYETLILNLKRGDNLFGSLNWYVKLLGCDNHILYRGEEVVGSVYASFGLPENKVQDVLKGYAAKNNAKYFNIENGFLAFTGIALLDSARSHSLLLDEKSMYFDGISGSSIEDEILFSPDLTQEENANINNLIQRITINNLSKYNHAPQMLPVLPGDNDNKILVVDQRFGDKSIGYAGANEDTFRLMLIDAQRENPGSDIIVKVHPDALTGLVKGHFDKSIEDVPRVYFYAEDINPMCLLKSVQSVYVVSSQMGYEALMLNKKVYVYGKAIYSGWGLTVDRAINDRRGNQKRSLQQIFKILYLNDIPYIDPFTGNITSLDLYLDSLMKARGGASSGDMLVNIGDGQLIYNKTTNQYFIEKDGVVTLNTVLSIFNSLTTIQEVERVLMNLFGTQTLPVGSDLLIMIAQYLGSEITLAELIALFHKYSKLNELFNVLKIFHYLLSNESLLDICSYIADKSNSQAFLEKHLFWSAGIFAKRELESMSIHSLIAKSQLDDQVLKQNIVEFAAALN